ncbi:hypothetical protein G7Y89_g4135 [Cudoniella acicularis]|uniref:Uncharacterized protein n=1 Tax=Cudoniella acicularis TaxID=354080 RepID=A0A8H4W5A8_9HELO|nr:hypothetical protein G7Y89_g4135 [Cudoniella acicularis]
MAQSIASLIADDLAGLDSIVVYDIQSNQFFTQPATNALPLTKYYKENSRYLPTWGSSKLQEIFEGNTTSASFTSSSSSTGSSSSTSVTPPPNGNDKSNTGAIAGGAVDGLAGLALIGSSIFWFTKRKKSKMYSPASRTPPFEMSEQEMARTLWIRGQGNQLSKSIAYRYAP